MTKGIDRRGVLLAGTGGAFGLYSFAAGAAPATKQLKLHRKAGVKPKNILVILTDDHRYDAMGFMKAQDFGETPTLDRLAREGIHFRNAFVTTALCSPSRASIFTGLYAHQHRVVDNNHPIPPGLTYYPEYLQAAGYETAFIGKWHMGIETDSPQPGFDHWVSFAGQGSYLPKGDFNQNQQQTLNVDGKRIDRTDYMTDELTRYQMDWLKSGRHKSKPFFIYISHKAVHGPCIPAPRHASQYQGATMKLPASFANRPENNKGKPMWVVNQRNSWHGIDIRYPNGLESMLADRRACDSVLSSIDDSI